MTGTVKDVMTPEPRTVEVDTSIAEAARIMRDDDVGAVVVVQSGKVGGMLTDRDIVVRAAADHRDLESTSVGQIASKEVTGLSPNANRPLAHHLRGLVDGHDMASEPQRRAARRNIKSAIIAAKSKRSIAHMPKATRTAPGKQAAAVAKRKKTGARSPMTRAELYELAKRRGLAGRSRMGRDELARALGRR